MKPESSGLVLGAALFVCLQLAVATYEARMLTGLLGNVHAQVSHRVGLIVSGARG